MYYLGLSSWLGTALPHFQLVSSLIVETKVIDNPVGYKSTPVGISKYGIV